MINSVYYHLYVDSKKKKKNGKKQKSAHRYRKQSTAYQWGQKGSGERQGQEINRYKLLSPKEISYEDILDSTRNRANILK